MRMTASKPHYPLLDALRGVAALLVICYHVGEGFGATPADIVVNHGYLAVDFFFMLSGFVIAYSYDDRWGGGMTAGRFLLRRVVRLQPMVAAGVLLGVLSYCAQGCVTWSGEHVSGWWIALSAVMALCMIPCVPGTGAEIRGNGEMFPVNGPEWSLFFEYIGYVFYAFVVRRLGTRSLAVLTAVAGAGLVAAGVADMCGYGGIGMGWTLGGYNFAGGMLRLLFAFNMGMLLQRVFRPVRVRYAFVVCSIVLAVVMAMPYVGMAEMPWVNGLYDSLCVTMVFPAVVWIAACGDAESHAERRMCNFLGDISYPVYIVHYPFMYLLYAYVWREGLGFTQVLPAVAAVVACSLVTAWAAMRFYDAPVRRWLTGRIFCSK